MRYMGLDYGDKTVGVAVSDALGITAQPLETITRERPTKLRKTYQRIEAIIAEYGVEKIVVGKPLNMNGTAGKRVALTESFGEELERRTGLEIIYVDERLTTAEADRLLELQDVKSGDRKEYIDKMAAAIILRTYLERHRS